MLIHKNENKDFELRKKYYHEINELIKKIQSIRQSHGFKQNYMLISWKDTVNTRN